MELSQQEKKEYAKMLYLSQHDLQQKDLAKKVGVTEQTITAWKKEGEWEKQRTQFITTRQNQLSTLYVQLENINEAIANRPTGQNFPQKGEADTISKLVAAIKNLETEKGVSEIVDVGTDILKWALKNGVALDEVQRISTVFDAYIKTKIR
jgi:uncharacterized protein YjcR